MSEITRFLPSDPNPDEAPEAEPFPWRPVQESYDLIGKPHRGGMGAVWKAREKVTGREVAIKRILTKKAKDPLAHRRFRQEARSVARLNHPGIIQLYQVSRDERGEYLVLEWARNGSLDDSLRKHGPLPIERVVAIARQVGKALRFAHAEGVIHRDIKPANLLVGSRGETKIADFGLARLRSATHSGHQMDPSLTQPQTAAGSPMFMPPEQWDASQANARSDLYSLGKTLYRLGACRT